MSDIQVLKKIFNAFDPFRTAEDPYYVDCHEVRGNSNIIEKLGRKIIFSEQNTCQLYTGHRGGGKSTELLQLKNYLEKENYKVIYFAATEDIINLNDIQYADILLSCLRQLLVELKEDSTPSDILKWIKDRWESFKDFTTREVSFGDLNIEAQICEFIKITTSLRTIPTAKEVIRKEINKDSISLTIILNNYIKKAVENMKKKGIVLIVDNLDRIIPVLNEISGKFNYQEIFIDKGDSLRGLQCHLIYTVPISMVYSSFSNILRERYNDVIVLPMIMVNDQYDKLYPSGIAKIKEIIQKRLEHAYPNLKMENIFEIKALEKLCLFSGGHIRDLMHLMQTAVQHMPQLPISIDSVNRAVGDLKLSYIRSIDETNWRLLAHVHDSKKMPPEAKFLDLLYYRYILEYISDQQETWHDVHPVIKDSQRMKQEMEKFKHVIT